MVLECVYNNKPCKDSMQVVDSQSQEHGNCFSLVQEAPATTSGQSYGLRISFNIEVYDTLGLITSEAGLKVYVSPPDQYDWNNDIYINKASEINLAPGFQYSISVKPSRMEKLPAPYSDCENYREGKLKSFNSKQDCQTFCVDKLDHQIPYFRKLVNLNFIFILEIITSGKRPENAAAWTM